MKKKGFIATSLIYSFFLVFLAILAGLVRNYVANKVILDRFNEDAAHGLNYDTYKITIVAYDSDIKRGHTITNLIQDGNFSENIDKWWTFSGNIQAYTETAYQRARLTAASPNSYIYQNVSLNAGRTYYMRVDYAKTFDDLVYVGIDDNRLTLSKSDNMTRQSMNFVANNTLERTPLSIGYSEFAYSSPLFVTNVMLINLTDHFEKGNVPSSDWLDENIDHFDGTISYIIEDFYSEDQYEVLVAGAMDYKKAYLTCVGQNGKWSNMTNRELETEYDEESERYLTTVKLDNITDDIKCNVRWSK